MVAISLYRGNLHRVSDAPRQWPMPPHTLTLEQFRILTRKRSQTLARLATAQSSNSNDDNSNNKDKGPLIKVKEEVEELRDPQPTQVEEASKKEAPVEDSKMIDAEVKNSEIKASDVKMEVSNDLDTVSDKEKRKIELEKKLQVLNQKKHNLVQMLKQILNAEEEIKRRNAHSAALHSSMPLQSETAVDMGSATRHVPKLSVEVNFSGDLGLESDATANQNAHGRQMYHMHSISPSASSLTRPSHGSSQQNALLPTPRSSLVTFGLGQTPSNVFAGSGVAAAIASPSRFAPTGHQAYHHSASLPPVSVPGAHFMVTSPSPAASGGASSVFKDSRLTSSS